MTEIVGSNNLDNKSPSNQFQKDIESTDFSMDLSNYKEMLELSNKIPKWNKIFDALKNISRYIIVKNVARRDHLMKYCRDCTVKFVFDTINHHTNHNRKRKIQSQILGGVSRICKAVICRCSDFFLAKKEENETALKVRMDAHQSTELRRECGGKYSMRNKAKHCITKKHLTFCPESKK